MPIYEYGHDDGGCTVIGGYVYRGQGEARPSGAATSSATTAAAIVWSLRVRNGKATGVRREPFRIEGLTSFGENAAGEIFATTEVGEITADRPADLAGAAPDARRLAERGVREGIQRLVQLAKLTRDERESLLLLVRPVQALELSRDPVETLEHGVELPVSEILRRLHVADSTPRPRAARRPCGRRPHRRRASRAGARARRRPSRARRCGGRRRAARARRVRAAPGRR